MAARPGLDCSKSGSASAAARSTSCTPMRWSASARKGAPPYEFGVKVSWPRRWRSKGGQFALHAMAFSATLMTATRSKRSFRDGTPPSGRDRAHLADAGYRGHNAPLSDKFRIFTAGERRRVTRRSSQPRRRSAVEPVIGHIKSEQDGLQLPRPRPGRSINAILAAAGYNFSLLVNWLKVVSWLLIAAFRSVKVVRRLRDLIVHARLPPS